MPFVRRQSHAAAGSYDAGRPRRLFLCIACWSHFNVFRHNLACFGNIQTPNDSGVSQLSARSTQSRVYD